MDTRIKELIAIGASVTANCEPCLDYHMSKAKDAGADEREITLAIEVAKAVRKGAMSKMDKYVSAVSNSPAGTSSAPEKACGCGCS